MESIVGNWPWYDSTNICMFLNKIGQDLFKLMSQEKCNTNITHQTSPEILSFWTVAVVTHLVVDCELHHKHLLQDGRSYHLTLNRELHLDAFWVRLSPHKSGIYKLHTVQTLNLAQTQGQHFPRLQRASHPVIRRFQVSKKKKLHAHIIFWLIFSHLYSVIYSYTILLNLTPSL